MKKIYDGFTFFNELDLLELRFEELYDTVDFFILVESDHTFTNIPKPYYFEENKERYTKFLDKVIHIKLKSNQHSNPWMNEHDQRNGISEGIVNAAPEDIIFISDLDEIPRPSILKIARSIKRDVFAFKTAFFYFKLNFVSTYAYETLVLGVPKEILSRFCPQDIRAHRHIIKDFCKTYNFSCAEFPHASWHFGYLGDDEFLRTKMKSFSHAQDLTPSQIESYNLNTELYNGDPYRFFVKLDDYFPQSVLNNKEKYKKYIEEGDYPTVYQVFENQKQKKASACIIAHNEETCIARAIQSLRDIEVVDDIVVVDSGSTDNTVAICKSLGCRVFYRAIDGDFAAQRNFAAAQCKHDWIIVADADEWYPKSTRESISTLLKGDMENYAVVRLPEITMIEHTLTDITTEVINEIFGSKTQEELIVGCTSYLPDQVHAHFSYTYRILNKARGEWVNKIHEVFQPHSEFNTLVLPRDQYLLHQKSWTQQHRSESGYFIQNYGISACLYQTEYDDFDGTVSRKSVEILDDMFRRIVTEVMSCDMFIEAGAFNGETSRQIKTLVPNASVYAFEANPYNYKEFLPLFNDTQINYLHYALSDKNEDVTFRVHTTINGIDIPVVKGNDSLLMRNNPNVTYENFTVKGITLDNYFSDKVNTNDSIAMWVDLEGIAFQALEGAVKLLANVDVMKIEVESFQHWQNQKLDEDIRMFLSRYGFFPVIRDYEYPNQYNILFCKKPIIYSQKFAEMIQSYGNIRQIDGIF